MGVEQMRTGPDPMPRVWKVLVAVTATAWLVLALAMVSTASLR